MATTLLPGDTPSPGRSGEADPGPRPGGSAGACWLRFCFALAWLALLTGTVAVTTTSTAGAVLRVAMWSWVLGMGALFFLPPRRSDPEPESGREQLP